MKSSREWGREGIKELRLEEGRLIRVSSAARFLKGIVLCLCKVRDRLPPGESFRGTRQTSLHLSCGGINN